MLNGKPHTIIPNIEFYCTENLLRHRIIKYSKNQFRNFPIIDQFAVDISVNSKKFVNALLLGTFRGRNVMRELTVSVLGRKAHQSKAISVLTFV